jgi:lysozyme
MCALLSLALVGCDDGAEIDRLEDAARVCPAGTTLEGIDVSIYQGTIDWAKVKADGIVFAFIRVSDGLPPIDSKFQENWTGARAAGVVRGAYQFFRQDEDPVAQADLLLDTMGPLEDDDLPPVVDVESTDGAGPAEIVANVRTWADRIRAGTGRRPIIYTGPSFWNVQAGGSAGVTDLYLWLAHWTTSCPDVPKGFTTWTFWQYSSTGTVSGISGAVDRDRFDGDRQALDRMIAASHIDGPPDAGAPDAAPVPGPPDAGPAAAVSSTVGGCGVAGGDSFWWGMVLYFYYLWPHRRLRSAMLASRA